MYRRTVPAVTPSSSATWLVVRRSSDLLAAALAAFYLGRPIDPIIRIERPERWERVVRVARTERSERLA